MPSVFATAPKLWLMAASGALQQVIDEVTGGADIEELGGPREGTALIAASLTGEHDVVQYLLDSKANIDSVNNQGQTALHRASYFGRDKVVQLLINRGADIGVKDLDGNLAIDVARSRRHYVVLSMLELEGMRRVVFN
jgi:ankyrin repeat protein